MEAIKFAFWVIANVVTLAVIGGFGLATITVPLALTVMVVWAVIIWGGILILDDLDF